MFEITEVIEKGSKRNGPFVVSFDNGTLVKDGGSKVDLEVLGQQNERKTIKMKMTNGHEFVGQEEEMGPLRSFLLIKNRHTNKVRLVETGNAVLRNSVLLTTTTPSVPSTLPEAKGVGHAKLHKLFGGKKQIRKLEQKEKLKLDISAVESTLIETVNAMEVVAEEVSTADQMGESLKEILPPCHRDADNVSEVYKLQEICNELLMESAEIIEMMADEEYCKEVFSELSPLSVYCWREAEKFSGEERKLKFFLSAVVEGLLKITKTKSHELRKRSLTLSSYTSIFNWLTTNFCHKSANNQLSRSNSMRDKTLCYLMAVIFLITEYSIPLNLLATETSIGIKKLQQLCRAVGGAPKARGDFTYILKLPLPPLPTLAFGKRSK